MFVTEQVRTQHAEQLLTGAGNTIGRLPLAHGRLGDLAQPGDGSGAAELFDDVGYVHAPILGELKPERNKHAKENCEYAMTMLKDRLRRAMDGPPHVSQVALAKACGVTGPAVNDWLSGKTKTMRGEYLMAAARFLGVSADWLASGKGPMRLNDPVTETNSHAESAPPSHPMRLDRVRMRDAIELLGYLAELQATPTAALTSDPEAIAIAYDYLTEMEGSDGAADTLGITKQIAARIRGNDGGEGKKGGKAS